MSSSTFTIETRKDGIAVITIATPNNASNILPSDFDHELHTVLDQVEQERKVKGVVFIGSKGHFISGLDVTALEKCHAAGQAESLALRYQSVLSRIRNNKKPFVAAIHGAALGGGYELALACHGRIATDAPATVVGLPEIMLGVIPCAGGSQYLPRLIGLQHALPLLLQSKQVKARKACKQGLVDKVTSKQQLLDAAVEMAHSFIGKTPDQLKQNKKQLKDRLLEDNPLGRKVVFDQARKAVLKQTQGHYPAPLAAIEVMEYGLDHGLDAGLAFEAKRFGEIATTPVAKNLLHIFCADLALSETQYSDHPPQDITTVGILGGGLMGAGIGTVSLFNAKKKVIVKDRDADGIANANKHIKGAADRKLQFNSITEAEHRTFLENYRGVIDYAALASCDMIIEAVFEDLSLKHQIVEDIESHCNEQTIFASNTSSLSVADIAAHAKRPENILAMHYFSPVEKMPLLEIVKHEGTSDTAIATAVELGRQQGKKVIVVKDGAGFYVNRMLFPYANEIAWMALEGVPLDVLDKTMQEAGFPVGPISLLDEVGFDIAAKVQNNLETGFGHRFTAPNLLPKLIEDGRLGRKSRKGMYLYDQDTGKKLKEIDPLIYSLMGVKPTHSIPEDTLKLRAILPMLNEAVRCLEDGTIASPIDGDIGAIFGVGFIPFSGGPFKLIDSMSAGAVVNQLQRHEEEFGARFTPCDLLIEHARKAKTFY